MAAVYIPGYLTDITIDTQTMDAFANTATLAMTKGVADKSAFGSQFKRKLGGQIEATIEVAGHGDPSIIEAMDAAFRKDSVAWVFQIGDSAGATNSGQYAGNGIVSAFTPADAVADGEIEFALTIEVDGDPAYTPPV